MSKEKMEKMVADHKIMLDKIKKEFKVDEVRANQAINIACDFNLEDEADMMHKLGIIIHTIKRIED